MNNVEDLELQRELSQLELFILPCSEPIADEFKKQYQAAYDLWHLVWSKTLYELDGVEKLNSNEFTRHDFLSVIMKGDTAIGLFCYSSVDLSLSVRRNDSWFNAWPKDLLEELSSQCRYGIMPSWLAVHPDYRRSKSNYPINLGQVVMEVYAKILVSYGYEMGFGTTRNNRGVNTLITNTGGRKLMGSTDHGVEVDLIQMNPADILLKENNFSKVTKVLWEKKVDIWRESYEFKIKETA